MGSELKNIVIIGNGCASAECVKSLRENGYKGKILLLSENHWPVFNPMLITYYLADKIFFDELFPYGRGNEFYKKYGVDVYFESPATDINPEDKVVYTSSGKELKYDRCLIATGARPIIPSIKGIESDRVFHVRTVEDTIRMKIFLKNNPQKALVVGASLIGIKIVEVLYQRGIEVYLLDVAKHIFPFNAHPECAQIIEERLKQRGIKLRFGNEIEMIKETESGLRVYLKDKSVIEMDMVVICIGVKPNTEFVKGKVAIDRGILIDEYTRTYTKDIYAAGDVAQGKTILSGKSQVIGLLSNARYQGRTAGKNMVGKIEYLPEVLPHNIAHFLGMDFISIGDIVCYDKEEIISKGEKFIQFFWKDKFLTGVNVLDSYQDSGILKSIIIKSLINKTVVSADKASLIQTQLLRKLRGFTPG